MDTRPRDPAALRRGGIIQKLLGGLNLKFPGLFALLAVVTLLDLLTPDLIPFVDEIVLALLTMIFALWKDRRATDVATPPARPPLPGTGAPFPPGRPGPD